MYQNIVIDGEDLGQNPDKRFSKYWNEGKWINFIEPLLPESKDSTFVEIGCNAGLFPKMAKEYGFRDVIGVEQSKRAYKKALEYRDFNELDYKLLHRKVGENFSFDELPVADVTLLSTVHYYFDINSWIKYLDELQYKTCYCLIVSRPLKKIGHWIPGAEYSDVRNYFRHWREVGAIHTIREPGVRIVDPDDPHPRTLWSLLFQSSLKRMEFTDIFRDFKDDGVDLAAVELAKEVIKNDDIDVTDTDYYAAWRKRKAGQWPPPKILQFTQGKLDLMQDIKKNGLKYPLLVQMSGKLTDGGHRMTMLQALGYESAIVRIV